VRVREVAARLEISPSLVYQLIDAGKLRCSRHGLGRGVIRVSEEQLANYLARAVEPEKMPSRVSNGTAGSFKHLDAAKLREAWKRRD
jgi:excisionase family DNA binding protein